MGTSGSIHHIPAIANKDVYKKSSKAWIGLKAAIRFHNFNSGLWSAMRNDREPWRTLLKNAALDFDLEREKLALNTIELESTEHFQAMINGTIPPESVPRSGREVWVFISSTFTDTMIERDTLLTDVYPYIRDYCRQIGMDFNVVDFRWGIRQGASNRHMAAEICLREVARCRENSIGPYFVAILGDKYGYRPIPPKLPEVVYQMVLGHLEKEETKESMETVNLMKEWYKADTNSLEVTYLLQPINSKLKNFYSSNTELAMVDWAEWYRIFQVMQTSIFRAIRHCGLEPQLVQELTQSITEGEIHEGLKGMKTEADQVSRCFMFSRYLSGIDEKEDYAKRFLDCGDQQAQIQSQQKLVELKEYLVQKLPADALCKYSLRYRSSRETMMNDEWNKETLRNFCDKFCMFMINSIKSYARTSLQHMDNQLYMEVLSHSTFCRERAETVIGQEEPLGTLLAHLGQEHGRKPYVIHGIGGSGKTSLIAKLFSMSLDRYQGTQENRPKHVIRFIGITPQSSNIRDLLFSICEQISFCLDLDEGDVPHDYKQLEVKFAELLGMASKTNPIMIFLDSLDQLSDEYQGRDLLWLPRQLPSYVHMVVTVRPDAGFCLSAIKNLVNDMKFFMEMKPIKDSAKSDIIDSLMNRVGRTLTKEQKKIVLRAHQDNKPTALYIKIACDMADAWHSYTPLSTCRLAGTITGIITQLFEELEEQHGMIFVARALGYLTCSRSGLTANELMDILSCDDTVLEDVYEYFVPPVRRLPPLLWTRLRLSLGDYLVESGADNMVVYRWYHRIFFEVAHRRYVEPTRKQLHQNIADYFMERWAYQPKPYVDKRTKKVDIAFRQVQSQPLVLDGKREAARSLGSALLKMRRSDVAQATRYNLRKLTELPTHLVKAEMWEEVESVMCSIPWLEAKCRTGRIYQLLLELAEAADLSDHRSSKLQDFYAMVRANAAIIQRNPELITQQALNEPDSSACCQVASAYIKENHSKMLCWQSLSKSQIQSAEVMTLTHTAPVTLVQFSPKGKFLVTACSDNTVRIWRVASGALEVTIETTAHSAIFPPNSNWVAIMEPKSIGVYGVGEAGLSKGKLLRRIVAEVEPTNGAMFVTANSKHLYLYSFGRVTIFNAVSGKVVQKIDLRCRAKAVAFSPNGKMLGIAYKDIFIFDISSDKVLKRLEGDNLKQDMLPETSLAFSSDNKFLCGVLPNGTYRWQVKGNERNFIGHKLSLNCHVGPAVFSPNLDFILSLSQGEEAEVLRMKSVEWRRLEGHKGPIRCGDFCQKSAQFGMLATGSDDHTVRIWDTKHISGLVASKVKVQNVHDGPVSGCVFSPDGSKAVTSCHGKQCILWDLNQSVPQATRILASKPSCNLEKVVCISEDCVFVVATCNTSDFGIWNTKATPCVSDKITIMVQHRLIPYVDPSYLFVYVRDVGLACFTTTNKPGTIFLLEIMSPACVEDWRTYPDEIPLFNGYSSAVREFDHGPQYKIMSTAMSPDQKQLASIAVKVSDDSLSPQVIAKETASFLANPPIIRIWDRSKGTPLAEMELGVTMTRYHKIRYLRDQLITFMHVQGNDQLSSQNGKRRSARMKRIMQEQQKQGVALVQVLDPKSGKIIFTDRQAGSFTNLRVPYTNFVDARGDARANAQRCLLSYIEQGILVTRRVGEGQPMGKFQEKNDDVTAYAFSSDCTRAIVGVDDGTVHVLRMVTEGNI
ncbi:NACHT domain- and WD repeat-containing protein 1-like [Diadema setosum]|uniref:NACHT domain- and WD repeat-containing protein 1-like n=1 Tax=Diadema setosum TaxID=31175 RepID=UPI003B3B5158